MGTLSLLSYSRKKSANTGIVIGYYLQKLEKVKVIVYIGTLLSPAGGNGEDYFMMQFEKIPVFGQKELLIIVFELLRLHSYSNVSVNITFGQWFMTSAP